jgi:hypothetical protein
MAQSEVKIQIPVELVRATVLNELTNQLGGGDAPAFLAELVAKYLATGTERSYGKETHYQSMIREFIAQTARQVFKELLEEQAPQIKAALKKHIQTATGAKKIADALAAAITTNSYRFEIRLGSGD